MAGYADLLQNNPLVFVPLSPLLNNGLNMLFQHGQQQRAEAQQAKAQKKADMWGGIGLAKDIGLSAATLGTIGSLGEPAGAVADTASKAAVPDGAMSTVPGAGGQDDMFHGWGPLG